MPYNPGMSQIDPVLLKPRLGALAGRFDVDVLTECDSTSSELARRAERGAPSGTVVVAERQTAGRGRRGRHWLSEPGKSLTFSLLWRFSCAPARLAGLSLAVGVALARACEGLGALGVRLKWPNDVLLVQGGSHAKLAGILIELFPERRNTQLILGIGLNLAAPSGALAQPAAGLDQALPARVEVHDLLAAVLLALAEVLERFESAGFAAFRDEWLRRHAWQDASVRILGEGEEIAGRCSGVDASGALLLETASGMRTVYSGDVSLRCT